MALQDSLRTGTTWLITKGTGSFAVQFVFGVILARLLVPEEFGMMVTIQIFTGLATVVAVGGMSKALVQAREVEQRHYNTAFTLQLLIGAGLFLLFYLLAWPFAAWYDDPLYRPLLQTAAVGFLLRPLMNTHAAWMHREMRFKAFALVSFGGMFLSGLAGIAMAWHGMGVWSLVLSGLLGTFIQILLSKRVVRLPLALQLDRRAVGDLGRYGVRIQANNVAFHINRQVENFLISRTLGEHFLGLYNKAGSLFQIPAEMIGTPAYATTFRALSKLQDNADQSRWLYRRTLSLVTLYMLPIYVSLFWLAPAFITLVYGPNWSPAALPLQILSLIGLSQCIIRPSRAVTAARNWLGRELALQVESALVIAVGCLIGLRWGMVGVAWAMVPCQAWIALRFFALARRSLGARWSDLPAALAAPVLLNLLLFGFLAGLDGLWQQQLGGGTISWPYLFGMAAAAVLFYLLMFLTLPLAGIRDEVQRWRRWLLRRG